MKHDIGFSQVLIEIYIIANQKLNSIFVRAPPSGREGRRLNRTIQGSKTGGGYGLDVKKSEDFLNKRRSWLSNAM
jgi:hypothetical protein